MTERKKIILIQGLIILLGALLFIPGLGSVHLFDWDEINFAESAREMIVTGNYLTVQVNYEPFWEKPPLFTWMQVLSMKTFGINEFAARFPNAICGIITLLVLFNIGRKLKDTRFGLIWTLLYACSITPFFFFKSGIIDPWFNLFIFLGTYFFILFTRPDNTRNPYMLVSLSALFLGLAVLTKGPVGFLIFLLTFGVYLIFHKFKLKYNWKEVVLFFLILAFVGGFWFLLQIMNGNFDIIKDFIVYQIRLFQTEDAGHGGFFLYHFVVLLLGVFPASILALPTFRRSILKDENDADMKHFFQWMMMLFWVVLILFTIVRTKIVHYSSMCYFPLTFLAAWYTMQILENKRQVTKLIKIPMLIIGCLAGIVAAVIPFFDQFKHLIIPMMDEFTQGNMQATTSWYGFEWLSGVILIAGTVLFVIFSNKGQASRGLACLLLGSLLFVSSGMFFIAPQVEKYSQLSAIEFYENKQKEDCYILSISKSYAPYFYGKRLPGNCNADREYLQRGDINKPVYFVVKNSKSRVSRFLEETTDPVRLYDKNGFVFYARYPQEDTEIKTN